jgi:hypothetical protein
VEFHLFGRVSAANPNHPNTHRHAPDMVWESGPNILLDHFMCILGKKPEKKQQQSSQKGVSLGRFRAS